MNPARGLILFAHGARDPRWAEPFEAVAAQICTLQPGLQVRTAFLEFMQPGLVDAGAGLASAGCTEVTVVPMFLGAGGHVRKDLPLLMQTLRDAHPGTRFELTPAIGEIPSVLQAMAAAVLTHVDAA